MSDTTEIDFDGLQAVAEAAKGETDGEWQWVWHDQSGWIVLEDGVGDAIIRHAPGERIPKWRASHDTVSGAHIAAFDPSTALALLALARRAVDAEAEAARLREENGALVAALKAFVNDTITTTATRDLWWCSHPTCKFMDHAQTAGELRHHPDCPVPGAEALLAQAKGDTK